jgi:glycosyltransferase involved in cell wall biosynthesis
MRLLVWTQYFWPETFRINDVVAALVRRGLAVTVLTGKPNYPDGEFFPGYHASGTKREAFAGARVVRIPMLARGMRSAVRLTFNYVSFILSGYLVAPLALRRDKFDAVLVYAPSPLLQAMPAVFTAFVKKAPLFVWVQDLWPEALLATGYVRNPLLLRLVERLIRHIYRRADVILIQSQAFRQPVERLTDDPGKIRFLPHAANAPDFSVPPSHEALDLAGRMKSTFAVAFAGNIGQAQSMETVVEAAALLRERDDITVFIIGSGSRLDWLKREIEGRRLRNLQAVGRFVEQDMPTVLGAASALLVTLGDDPVGTSTIPSKLQTYLSMGRPVIASMNGEGARIVADAKAGLTCRAKDSEALAKAIAELATESPAVLEAYGANARHYFFEHFKVDRLTDELISYLKKMEGTSKQ